MRKLTQTLFLVLLAMITSTAYADNVAKIGDTEYATLQAAIDNATSGQTVVLLKDVDATGTMSSVDNRFNLWIKTSITIDGDGHKLTVKGRGIGVQGASSNIDVTFQNITVNSGHHRYCDLHGGGIFKTPRRSSNIVLRFPGESTAVITDIKDL